MKKTLVIIALLLTATSATQLHAQKTNTWKGGFPGQESNWNCPRNWSLGTVPDWTCQVVIPQQTSDRKNYPVVSSRNEEIYSLVIQPGARLEIAPSGDLSVSGFLSAPLTDVGSLVVYGKFETPTGAAWEIAKQ